MNPQLLDILCCPETQQRLQIAEGALISELNEKIKNSQLRNRAGKVVNLQIDSGLLREDRKFLYPVRNNIPVLFIDEAIPL
jgi:uncharacterized protein YbaR (Trm112 family)